MRLIDAIIRDWPEPAASRAAPNRTRTQEQAVFTVAPTPADAQRAGALLRRSW